MDLSIKMQKNKNKKKKKKRISSNVIAAVGAFIIVIGGFFLSYNYVQEKKMMAYDYMANVFYNENDQEPIIEYEGEKKGEIPTEEAPNEQVTNEYIGYLNIPKINLTKGFLNKNASDNDVEKNILVVEGSTYPDVEKGNLILAGHSGTGWKAFFNDLYQLNVGDVAYVEYKNKKYTYKIVNIYKQQKVGTIAIYRDYNKTTLTLVTCTNNDSTTQTIYIAQLQEVTDK